MSVIYKISVKELICNDKKYIIPSYQRGYRWRATKEVQKLLTDIRDFKGSTYWLQPIVVKDNGSEFEVIDGQQRITTLYLLCKCLSEDVSISEDVRKEWDPQSRCTITYETREDSAAFLQNINSDKKHENIDYFYIDDAYNFIKNFTKDKDFIKQLEKVRAIWYVSEEQSGYDLFKRLNSYRISLTNAELIRALFLKKDCQDSEEIGIDKNRQFEMATEWDQMELKLRNPSFWYFLTDEDAENYPCRLELIFRFMTNSPGKGTGSYEVFDQFESVLKSAKNSEEKYELWQKVSNCFNTLHDWYSDHDLYHLIGFLVAARSVDKINFSMQDLVAEWIPQYTINTGKNNEKLPEDRKKFVGINREELIKFKIQQIILPEDKWDELQYDDNSKQNHIHNILLLFNILYVKDRGNKENRFPFHGYRKRNWSLEHIHPQNPNINNLREHLSDWWEKHKQFIPDGDEKKGFEEIVSQGDDKDVLSDSELKDVFSRVMNICNGNKRVDERHCLENMALLQGNINSSLKNYAFSVKRKMILEMDKPTGKEFILPCTLNVFLKYYTQDVCDMFFWNITDRSDYREAISKTLKPYLPA